jgi:hypothetical protein
LRAYDVQPCHHFGPPGATPPTYGVAVTTVPAFVAIAPVKIESPAVAIGEFAAGEKSKSLMLVGVAPTAGMLVKSGRSGGAAEGETVRREVQLERRRRSSRGGLEESWDVRREHVSHLEVCRRRRGRGRAGPGIRAGIANRRRAEGQRATTPLT